MIKSCKKPPVYFESTTGSFYSQYAGLPLKSCRVDLPVNQSGSGIPSPTNIRDFIPYTSLDFTANGTVKTFTFGQNVYIGYLDILTGVLTVTHGYVDLSTLDDWEIITINNIDCFRTTKLSNVKHELSSNNNAFCSIYPLMNSIAPSSISLTIGYVGYYSTSIIIHNDNITTVEDLIESLEGSQFVYPLATPITIPLGGMEINTILGLNSLSSSVGNISAEYLKAGR